LAADAVAGGGASLEPRFLRAVNTYVSTVVYSFNVLLMSVALRLAALNFRNGSLVLHADDEKENVSFFPAPAAATDPGSRVGLQVEKSSEMCQICMHACKL
jgi:hypothetical protein